MPEGLNSKLSKPPKPSKPPFQHSNINLLDPAQQLNRPRLLVVIEKKCLMFQPANQVVASAILYKPRLPHAEQCITKPITMSAILCQ